MPDTCHECGAPLPCDQSCAAHFNALLLLEYEVAANPDEVSGGRGEIAHFYAVSAYILQHPRQMNYTVEALASLRQTVADHLTGGITLVQLRHRTHNNPQRDTRVKRKDDDPIPTWPVRAWPTTVTDILAGGTAGYCSRVAAWARTVIQTLDEATA